MKAKKYWILTAILGIFVSVIWAVDKTESQITPQVTFMPKERDTLKGLQGVYVLVGNLKPEVEKYGLTTQQLKTDVELRLRQNDIRVLSEQEWLSTLGNPVLYVNVNIVVNEDIGFAAFSISLELKQKVFLARDIAKFCLASTWNSGDTGGVGSNNVKNIRDTVKDRVDGFINEYLAANPKEQPVPVEEKDKKPKDN
ncbi:MAG: hypothetical protein ABSG99_00710 [Sedimentisphaerales bacterium]